MKFTDLNLLRNVSGNRFLIAAFAGLCSFTLVGCTEDPITPKPEKDPVICPPHEPGSCTDADTYVTVRNISCAVGAFGDYWLQLDNGDYLQPWSAGTAPMLQDGDRFRISFDQVQRDNRYDTVITCLTLIALPEATPVHVNCMIPVQQNIPSNQCSVIVTADDVLCGFGAWGSMYLKLADGTHLQPWETTFSYQNLQDGEQYKIGYELMQPDSRYDSVFVCLAIPVDVTEIKPARITCIEPVSPVR